MNEDVAKFVLNGWHINQFLIILGWACFGGVISYYLHANNDRKHDPKTPNTWNWRLFFIGMKRMIISIALMAFFIIFWDDVSKIAFKLFFDIKIPAVLNGFSAAVIIGAGCDNLAKALFGGGKTATTYIKKKIAK